jgi:hypothetical protein
VPEPAFGAALLARANPLDRQLTYVLRSEYPLAGLPFPHWRAHKSEEPGWRGFALPRLQKLHSPLGASLILATAWGGWHLPLVSTELRIQYVPAFVLGIFSATIAYLDLLPHPPQRSTSGDIMFLIRRGLGS